MERRLQVGWEVLEDFFLLQNWGVIFWLCVGVFSFAAVRCMLLFVESVRTCRFVQHQSNAGVFHLD